MLWIGGASGIRNTDLEHFPLNNIRWCYVEIICDLSYWHIKYYFHCLSVVNCSLHLYYFNCMLLHYCNEYRLFFSFQPLFTYFLHLLYYNLNILYTNVFNQLILKLLIVVVLCSSDSYLCCFAVFILSVYFRYPLNVYQRRPHLVTLLYLF